MTKASLICGFNIYALALAVVENPKRLAARTLSTIAITAKVSRNTKPKNRNSIQVPIAPQRVLLMKEKGDIMPHLLP